MAEDIIKAQNNIHNTEMLECFDDSGNIIEPVLRRLAHEEPLKYNHAVVNIWLINKKGEILCSRRNEALKGNPGKWQTYFGGHLKAGITFIENAKLELEEEIGLNVRHEDLCLLDKGYYEPSKHFYESYIYIFDKPLTDLNFNDGEIIDIKWYSIEDYWKERGLNENKWCNGLTEYTEKKIEEFIKNSPEFLKRIV